MKRAVFLLISFLALTSCVTHITPTKTDENTDFREVTVIYKEEIIENRHFQPPEIFQYIDVKSIFDYNLLKLGSEIILPDYTIKETDNNVPDDPILKIVELKKRFFNYNEIVESPFIDNEISTIFADDFYYYLGTVRGGIFRYSLGRDDVIEIKTPFESISNQSITGIKKFNGMLVVTSYSGLYFYDISTFKLISNYNTQYYKGILTLFSNSKHVYMGTSDGKLLQWSDGTFRELINLNNNGIYSLLIDEKQILLGTSKSGLLKYNIDTEYLEPVYSVNEKLSNGKITFISLFDDKLWIGAAGDGLLVYDLDLENLITRESNEWFLSSCHSDNIIYFGTHRDGLLFYDRIKNKKSNWGIREGLPSLYIPSLFFKNSEIYISTPGKGIVIINEQINE